MININQQVKLLKEDYLTNSKLKEQSFKQIMNEMNLHYNQNKQVYIKCVYNIQHQTFGLNMDWSRTSIIELSQLWVE